MKKATNDCREAEQLRLVYRLFGSPTFNQPKPNWGLHLTPLRRAGEVGR